MTRPDHLRSEQEWLDHIAGCARETGCATDRDLAPARGTITSVFLGVIGWALIVLALFLLLVPTAHSQPRAIVNIGAWHGALETTYCPGAQQATELTDFTPGIGVAYDWSPEVMTAGGWWRTSQGNGSLFALIDYRPLRYRNASAGVFLAASGGYCKNEGRAMGIPGVSVRVDFTDKLSGHMLGVPKYDESQGSAAILFAVSYAFTL